MTTSGLDAVTLRRILRRQGGLLNTAQARLVGLSPDALTRRTRGLAATWKRVLPRVYACFPHDLSHRQRCIAAVLYAGADVMVTGLAALELYGFRRLPSPTLVEVLVPPRRRVSSRSFVRVVSTTRSPRPISVDGVACAPIGRSVLDAALRMHDYEEVLTVLAEAVQRGRVTTATLTGDLADAPRRGSALIRRALRSVADGAWSVAEDRALGLVRSAGLPPPTVNGGLLLPDEGFLCPDLRWKRLIVEIDSREWHLLLPGSWEASLQRRKRLERAGYVVLVVTPGELVSQPDQVIADIRDRLDRLAVLDVSTGLSTTGGAPAGSAPPGRGRSAPAPSSPARGP